MFHDGFMGRMWFGWIFWIVILVVVVWAVSQSTNRNKNIGQSSEQSHLDILKKRYAKSEITKEEFESMKKDLE